MGTQRESIDSYLQTLTGDRRRALERLRQTIRSIIPNAQECISYRIPAFRLNEKVVAGFMARKNGCPHLPFSGATLRTLARHVRGYEQTKSSLHFDAKKDLPVSLVRKLIKARIEETLE